MSLIIICGATATGKSELALSVAKELDAEIVNADSMQVYRGMDIGTAKLALEDRQGITHHLLDLLEITQEANVSWYQGLARAKIDEVLKTGKSVVVVGGTGLYIKAILDDLNFPDTDPVVRQQITDDCYFSCYSCSVDGFNATIDPKTVETNINITRTFGDDGICPSSLYL